MTKDLIIVLYGSTGDLTFRKLLPALSNLKKDNILPENTLILSIGRRDFDTNKYFRFINENNSKDDISNLEEITKYYKMQILEESDYNNLRDYIKPHLSNNTRVIHYLAVASNMMKDVALNLSKANIVLKGDKNQSLIFEKPFGTNLQTASKINEELLKLYTEDQIYRIDHYLGKPLIYSLLDIRFKNSLLSETLKSENVKKIKISLNEKEGILNRGAFYDETGAIKDMFQSHIMQILSLITMNKPKDFSSRNITKEKIHAMKKLRFDINSLVYGQYSSYLKEDNVSSNSKTETMFQGTFNSKTKYRNVLIEVETGKMLNEKYTNIKYILKDNSVVNLNIYPNNSITFKTNLIENEINFDYKFNTNMLEYAYLFNAIINFEKDKFLSTKEIELSWKITDEILTYKDKLKIY